jgi:uncharacterized protein
MMRHKIAAVLLCGWGLLPAASQQIQVSRENKTIAITAEDSVTVDPEIAIITVGYQNYAATNDAAYQENVRVSNDVAKALLSGGIPKSAIETERLRLQRPAGEEAWTAEEKKQRQFEALQTWTIHVTADRAQNVVDLALRAGANFLDDLDWDVSDPKVLQAKAGAAALVKAREIAEQMAKGLNAKMGDLIYASNRSSLPSVGSTTETIHVPVAPPPAPPHLLLYPKKVKSDATVYAVFAIQ